MNFDKISSYKPRAFVGQDADLVDTETVVSYYRKLIDEQVCSTDDFEKWLLKYSELAAALSQKGAILYINMACQTDDEVCSKKYKDFIENIVPNIKTLEDVLNKIFYLRKEELGKIDYHGKTRAFAVAGEDLIFNYKNSFMHIKNYSYSHIIIWIY